MSGQPPPAVRRSRNLARQLSVVQSEFNRDVTAVVFTLCCLALVSDRGITTFPNREQLRRPHRVSSVPKRACDRAMVLLASVEWPIAVLARLPQSACIGYMLRRGLRVLP